MVLFSANRAALNSDLSCSACLGGCLDAGAADLQRGCSNDGWFLNSNGMAGMWVGTEENEDVRALTSSVCLPLVQFFLTNIME